MEFLGNSVSIVIAFICFLVAEFLKNRNWVNKHSIPKIMGFLGIALSFFGYFFIEGFPAYEIYEVITYGLVSGLASTGFYELGKAFNGNKKSSVVNLLDDKEDDDEDSDEILG